MCCCGSSRTPIRSRAGRCDWKPGMPSTSKPTRSEANGEAIVILDGVHQSFGDVEVLKGVSFSVAKGGVACIIGPSGSGKSTLLRCINGLVPIKSGSIRVANFDVHALKTDQEKIALRPRNRRRGAFHRRWIDRGIRCALGALRSSAKGPYARVSVADPVSVARAPPR